MELHVLSVLVIHVSEAILSYTTADQERPCGALSCSPSPAAWLVVKPDSLCHIPFRPFSDPAPVTWHPLANVGYYCYNKVLMCFCIISIMIFKMYWL